jgi:hypothetical protein
MKTLLLSSATAAGAALIPTPIAVETVCAFVFAVTAVALIHWHYVRPGRCAAAVPPAARPPFSRTVPPFSL